MSDLIAHVTVVVKDTTLGISRKVFAGQPVPPDLVGAFHEATDGYEGDKKPAKKAPAKAEKAATEQ